MSAVFTKYLALQITTTGSSAAGSSVLTVSPQSAQPIPFRHVFLKICPFALLFRNTSCAKADPDPAAMRQARIAANTKLVFIFELVFILILLFAPEILGSGTLFMHRIPRSHQKAKSASETPH